MPRFAANLSFLYPDLPFLDRFEAAARDGFEGVEYLFPYAWPAREIAARLRDNGLQQVLFNAPAGGTDSDSAVAAWDQGLRGTACLPGQQPAWRFGVTLALDYASALNCPRIHVMAGLLPAGQTREALQDLLIENLRWACAEAASRAITLLIEPLNPRDMPGYFLFQQAQAHALRDAVGAANLQVQMDLYHCQITEGDIATKLRHYLPTGRVGHLQIASVPERQEPDSGELNYPYLFRLIDELGYPGWIGCEYRPRLGLQPGATSQGLAWRASCA